MGRITATFLLALTIMVGFISNPVQAEDYNQADVATVQQWATPAIVNYAKSRMAWFVEVGTQQDLQQIVDEMITDPKRAKEKFFHESVLLADPQPHSIYRLSQGGLLILGDREGKHPTIRINPGNYVYPGTERNTYHQFLRRPRVTDSDFGKDQVTYAQFMVIATYDGWTTEPGYLSTEGQELQRIVVKGWTWQNAKAAKCVYESTPMKALNTLLTTHPKIKDDWHGHAAHMEAIKLLAPGLIDVRDEYYNGPWQGQKPTISIPANLTAKASITNLLLLATQLHGSPFNESGNSEALQLNQFEDLWKDLFLPAIRNHEPVTNLTSWVDQVREEYGDYKSPDVERPNNERYFKKRAFAKVSSGNIGLIFDQCEGQNTWGGNVFHTDPVERGQFGLTVGIDIVHRHVLAEHLKRYQADMGKYWVHMDTVHWFPFALTDEEFANSDLSRMVEETAAKLPEQLREDFKKQTHRLKLRGTKAHAVCTPKRR